MKRFLIKQHDDGSWVLHESDDRGNVWPPTRKATARQVAARLLQLMDLGPVGPQIEPEVVGIEIEEDPKCPTTPST